MSLHKEKIVATYPYRDEHRTLLYEVVRFEHKKFAQRRPDGKGGWVWNLNGTRKVLYRLPEIREKPCVYITEGEKDADKLWGLGIPATTCPGGAGKWRSEYSEMLRGKRVVILPDNDEPGEQHALQVARSLLHVAEAVKIVRLPGLPPKGDVSDWLDAEHTKDELVEIVNATPALRLEDLPPDTATKQNPQKLALTRMRDLLSEPSPQVSWLVENLLPAGGFSAVVAKPKVGKTTLARNLALAVARGEPFLSRATQKGAVIYISLEEKREEVRKHFHCMGATGEEEVYVYISTAPVDAIKQIRDAVEEKKPALVIIDPLFRLIKVKDANDYAQVTQALEPLLALARETGTHVLCVHHASKSEREGGDSILGSTAIFASVDSALIMKRSERYRTLQSIQRYGEDLSETVLLFNSETKTLSLGGSKEEEEERRIADMIVEFLQVKHAPAEEREIHAEVEGRTAIKKRALRRLIEEGKVYRQERFPGKKGTRGNPFMYALDKCWFAGSHAFNGNQGTSNEKMDLTPRKDCSFAGSQKSPPCWEPANAGPEATFETWREIRKLFWGDDL
jgi:DNA primase